MLMTKFVGKPYAGKLHVRFDEGVGKVLSLPRSTLLVDFSPQRTLRIHEGHKDLKRTKYYLATSFVILLLRQPLLYNFKITRYPCKINKGILR